MDYYLLGLKSGLTWDQWYDMPLAVRNLCWTYFQAENDAAAEKAKG